MKTTIIGGVLFLAPLAVLAILLSKVFELSLKVAQPLDRIFEIDGMFGIASVNIVALLLIIGVCYGAGLLARWAFLSNRLRRLDGLLMDFIPTYAVFKTVLTSASADKSLDSLMKPVLVRFDDYEQIAFEIERSTEQSVVFLPGSPSAWAGSTVVLSADRVRSLDIPAHQAVRLLRTFGRGTLDSGVNRPV